MPGEAPSVGAPAAPAAAPATNSTPKQSGESAPIGESPPANGQTRGPDGKFASAQPKAETPPDPAPPKRKLKAYGREIDPDELSEEERYSLMEMGVGAKQRFTEMDRRNKELDARHARMKDRPWEALAEHGLTDEQIDALVEDRIISRNVRPNLTPELQALEAERKARADVEAKLKKIEEDKEAAEYEAHQEALSKLFDEHIPAALEAVGLPKSGDGMDAMREYLIEIVASGARLQDYHFKAAAKAADARLRRIHLGYIRGKKGKDLAEALGPEVAAELRRYDLEKLREKKAAAGQAAPSKPPPPEPKKSAGTPQLTEKQLREKWR